MLYCVVRSAEQVFRLHIGHNAVGSGWELAVDLNHLGHASRTPGCVSTAQFNGGGVYGDDLRLGIEGYIRHDPRWGSVGCETRRILDVIEPLIYDLVGA